MLWSEPTTKGIVHVFSNEATTGLLNLCYKFPWLREHLPTQTTSHVFKSCLYRRVQPKVVISFQQYFTPSNHPSFTHDVLSNDLLNKEILVLRHKYASYLHNINAIVFTILCPVKWAYSDPLNPVKSSNGTLCGCLWHQSRSNPLGLWPCEMPIKIANYGIYIVSSMDMISYHKGQVLSLWGECLDSGHSGQYKIDKSSLVWTIFRQSLHHEHCSLTHSSSRHYGWCYRCYTSPKSNQLVWGFDLVRRSLRVILSQVVMVFLRPSNHPAHSHKNTSYDLIKWYR